MPKDRTDQRQKGTQRELTKDEKVYRELPMRRVRYTNNERTGKKKRKEKEEEDIPRKNRPKTVKSTNRTS